MPRTAIIPAAAVVAAALLQSGAHAFVAPTGVLVGRKAAASPSTSSAIRASSPFQRSATAAAAVTGSTRSSSVLRMSEEDEDAKDEPKDEATEAEFEAELAKIKDARPKVSEMKAELDELGISYNDLLEKGDYYKRLAEARTRPDSTKAQFATGKFRSRDEVQQGYKVDRQNEYQDKMKREGKEE